MDVESVFGNTHTYHGVVLRSVALTNDVWTVVSGHAPRVLRLSPHRHVLLVKRCREPAYRLRFEPRSPMKLTHASLNEQTLEIQISSGDAVPGAEPGENSSGASSCRGVVAIAPGGTMPGGGNRAADRGEQAQLPKQLFVAATDSEYTGSVE